MAKHILRKKEALEFEAAFDQATMQRMDLAFTGQSDGRTRRAALAILTRSKTQLTEGMGPQDAEAFLFVAELLGKYVTRLQAFTKVMRAAQARLLLVLDQYASKVA